MQEGNAMQLQVQSGASGSPYEMGLHLNARWVDLRL
jgi:hypothetical protein